MKTLNKILLTGMIIGIGSLKNIKAQESEAYNQTIRLDDEFVCDAYVAHDTTISKNLSFADNFLISFKNFSANDVKRLLKENSDSAVCNLRYNRNFYNWFVKDAEPIFNYSSCNLKRFSLSQPVDNFRLLCGVKDKARPIFKEEFTGAIISLFSEQRNGEGGSLSTKEPNVFYVRLNKKRTVSVSIWYNPAWNVKGWDIQAYTMASYGPKYKIFFSKK